MVRILGSFFLLLHPLVDFFEKVFPAHSSSESLLDFDSSFFALLKVLLILSHLDFVLVKEGHFLCGRFTLYQQVFGQLVSTASSESSLQTNDNGLEFASISHKSISPSFALNVTQDAPLDHITRLFSLLSKSLGQNESKSRLDSSRRFGQNSHLGGF